MIRTYRKYSASEKKVLKFAARKYEGMERIQGTDYINHPINVAEYLFDHGYRGKYLFAAFCQDLLKYTDTTEEEIFNIVGRFTLDAVKLLTKEKEADIKEYLEKIKGSEIAYVVKVASIIDNLGDAFPTNRKFRTKYLLNTQQYYLDFAKGSPFERDFHNSYQHLKIFQEYENLKRIVVEVGNAYKAVNGDCKLNILDSFHYCKDSSEPFNIVCLLCKEDIEFAELKKGEKLVLTLDAFPTSELKIYSDEEEYNIANQNEPSFAIRSFLHSKQFMLVDGMEIPDPSACFTGFVKRIYKSIKLENEEFHTYSIDIDTLGIIISLELSEDKDLIPAPGNFVTAICKLKGRIDMEDQDPDYLETLSSAHIETESKEVDENKAEQIVTRYWVDGSDPGYKSALKVIATPLDIKFIHYNRNCKEGKEVEGENFYKIAIGMNFDYETATEKEFLEFIQSI